MSCECLTAKRSLAALLISTVRCESSMVQALATGNESATVADFLTVTPDASADLISL